MSGKTTAQLKSELNTLEFECNLGNTMKEWSEVTPNLYTLVVSSAKSGDSHAVNFGMRQIESRDGKFLVNGQPVFLRGTLECCIFPLTGTLPLDESGLEKNYSSSMKPISVPLISHEIGQYAVYPDLREIDGYTGVLDPLNFKAVRDDLAQKGRLHKAGEYLMASGKLAAILYKEEIERALKTPGFSGFQLLGLQDFSGQGTALVGLVNAFWDSKGIVEAAWFRQFNSPVVPLAHFEKATYYSDEHFTADIEIANYRQPMRHPVQVNWSLRDGKELFGSGTLKIDSLPIGIHKAGHFDLPPRTVKNARQLLLTVSITGTGWHNEWPVWVYPRLNTVDYGQVIATQNPDEALQALSKGRRVQAATLYL